MTMTNAAIWRRTAGRNGGSSYDKGDDKDEDER